MHVVNAASRKSPTLLLQNLELICRLAVDASLATNKIGVWGLRPQRVQGRALAFVHALPLHTRNRRAELRLQHLAGVVPGQRVSDNHLFGTFETGHALIAKESA